MEDGRLYTLYRNITKLPQGTTHQEAVAAFDAGSGKTIWEFKYPAPVAGIDFSQGFGPHSTPLIVGDRVFATSSRSEIFALDKTTGKQIWAHDMVKEYRAVPTGRGYTCSPIFYNGLVIVTMGGPDQAVAAFDAQTGKLAWKAGYFVWAPASPILIDVDGQRQLVVFGGDLIAGHGSGDRPFALEPSAQDRLGSQHQHAGVVGQPTICSSCRRPTAPAAARSSCVRPAARPRSPRSGPATGCASTSGR